MANHPSAIKRIGQNAERRLRNKSYRTIVKNAVKKYLSAVDNKEPELDAHLKSVVSLLHRGVSKGVYHKNTASRAISRLSKKMPSA